MASSPSVQAEALSFPTIENSNILNDGLLMGTDIMDLFNYFIPSIDPVFYQGPTNENDPMATDIGRT